MKNRWLNYGITQQEVTKEAGKLNTIRVSTTPLLLNVQIRTHKAILNKADVNKINVLNNYII